MPRKSRHPFILDYLLQINASSLLKQTQVNHPNTLSWTKKGSQSLSLLCWVININGRLSVRFTYFSDSEPRTIEYKIVKDPSNLGIGNIPYFVCPDTGKRCRKLFLVDGIICSRHRIEGALYQRQMWSKYYRRLDKVYGRDIKVDELYSQLGSAYFKQQYNKKYTRSYNKILRKIELLRRES